MSTTDRQYSSMTQDTLLPFTARIELDKMIYNPGNIIKGKVYLNCAQKLRCDILNVRLYGSAKISFADKLGSKTSRTLTKDKDGTQEIILVRSEHCLWITPNTNKHAQRTTNNNARTTSLMSSTSDHLEGIEPGVHTFHFAFPLPVPDTYSSFDGEGSPAEVQYHIILDALRKNSIILREDEIFTVVVPVYLENNPMAFESPEVMEYYAFDSGTVTAKMSLKKRGFVPGELIKGIVKIKNRSNEFIETASLQISQTIYAISETPNIIKKSATFETFRIEFLVEEVFPGSDYVHLIEYYVPAVVPNFEIPNCFKVDYNFVLTIGRNKKNMEKGFLQLKVPIIIGTNPTVVEKTKTFESVDYYPSFLPGSLPFDGCVKPNKTTYHPGDIIEGKVYLEFKKKLDFDMLTVKLYGSAKVSFNKEFSNQRLGPWTHNKPYEEESVLINKDLFLCKASRANEIAQYGTNDSAENILTSSRSDIVKGLKSGYHSFDFTFYLPKEDLYTSFDSEEIGYVKYYFILRAIWNGKVVFEKECPFAIVVPVNLRENHDASDSTGASDIYNFMNGTVTATMLMKKRGVVPGELIDGKIHIENNSDESIKTVFLQIIQNTIVLSRNLDAKLRSRTFETPKVRIPLKRIPAGESYSCNIQYRVPSVVPNFEIPGLLKVDYDLILTIKGDRRKLKNKPLTLKVPIIIGTHNTEIERAIRSYEENGNALVSSTSLNVESKSSINFNHLTDHVESLSIHL